MGKKIERTRSKTLPSSPTHSFSSSSSSSDFEFRISISPRKSSAALCPADELFYKGKILPLHTSPRISMVRTLLLASSSTSSSSDTATTTASRDSSSSNDSTSSSLFAADLSLLAATHPFPDSNRPSSATDDDHIPNPSNKGRKPNTQPTLLSRFSSVFKKDNHNNISQQQPASSSSNAKRVNSTAKDVIRKYLKKVKPLYDKLSSKHGHVRSPCVGGMSPVLETTSSSAPLRTTSSDILLKGTERSTSLLAESSGGPLSFSGNLKCPKMLKRGYVASCPSSMRSSPNHSGVLTRTGMPARHGGGAGASTSHGKGSYSSDASTMEELQNAIQGAIAHCKSSMLQTTTSSFNNNNINFLNNNNNNNNNNNISNKKCKALEI